MNSKNPTSKPEISPLTNTPSVPPTLPSAELTFNEAPLLGLAPGLSLLAPPKPIKKMNDEELRTWHSKLRDHKNYQTLQSHLALVGTTVVAKPSKSSKPKVDISEFQ